MLNIVTSADVLVLCGLLLLCRPLEVKVIQLLEVGGEDPCEDESKGSKDNPWDVEVGVDDNSGECEGNGGTDSRVEECDGVDKVLHPVWGASVGQLVRGDVDKELSKSREEDLRDLPPEGDVRDTGHAIDDAVRGVAATWGGLVDLVLDDGSCDTACGSEEETNGHACHGLDGEAQLGHEGVESKGDDGGEDDDGDRVEVSNQVVGDTTLDHGVGHVILGVPETTVGEDEDGDEEEDGTGVESLADLVHELVVPVDLGVDLAKLLELNRGLGLVPPCVTTTAKAHPSATAEAVHEYPPDVSEDGPLRWELDETRGSEDEDDGHEHVEDSWEQVGEPETNETGRVLGRDLEEGSDIDTAVEDEEVALDSLLWVDNNTLALLGNLDRCLLHWRLVTKQWAQGRLDETGSKGENNDRDDERGERGVWLANDRWDSGDNEEDVGNGSNTTSPADCLETSPVVVRNDSTPDRDEVGQESEGLGQGGGDC